jgi:hypothetical protein
MMKLMKRGRRAARWAVLSPFLFVATAIGAPASDDCSKAPFQDVPPSQREWELLARDSHRFRARLLSSGDWVYFGNPESNADGLRARGGEGWDTGRLAYSDSLVVRWDDVERLECNRGSDAGWGVHFGVLVGAVAFVGFHDEGWGWAVFSIPAGAVIGGIIGASRPIWRAVYCVSPARPGDGNPEP